MRFDQDKERAIVILGSARTAIGSFGKSLAGVESHELGAVAIRAAIARAGIDASAVDEVVLGCVGQVGPDAFHARRSALAAGVPTRSTAMNVNRLCGSGLQAIVSAGLDLRAADDEQVAVAGGAESMSRMPFLDYQARDGFRLADRTAFDGTLALVTDPWGRYPMGVTAEAVATRFGVTRKDQDEYAVLSQSRAAKAADAGSFAGQIAPVEVPSRGATTIFDADEHIRPTASLESLARLRPAFASKGTVTAGNSSGINDGAAAVVVTTAVSAHHLGVEPIARLLACERAGVEPEIMGYAPVHAIKRLLEVTGVGLSDVGVVELNEAFAAQALAVIRDVGLDMERTNPEGGAIALGHPVGATGAILVVKAIDQMIRHDLELAVVSMCIGGGQALAALLARA